MKRILSLTAVAALAFTTVASAQLLNFPVNVNPHHGSGVAIAGLFGKGMNDNSGKFTSFGAGARIGFGAINIAAGAMTTNLQPDSKIDFAGNAEFVVIKGGASPFAASIFGGFGTASDIGTRIPFGVGLSVAPPGGIFSVWAAPFYQIFSPSGSGGSVNDFGVSGGVRVGLPMGLGFGASIGWVNSDFGAPVTLGGTVAWKFSTAG